MEPGSRWITYDELRHCTATHDDPIPPAKPAVLRAMTIVLHDLKEEHCMAVFLDEASVADLMSDRKAHD